MVSSAHFRSLHAALTEQLLAHGELYASDVRLCLQRAELRYMSNAMEM
jgi:hypothetical protein